MTGTLVITSAAYSSPEFVSTFGLLPPAFLPIGNKRLYEAQAILVADIKCRKFLSIPADFDISPNELNHIHELGFEIIRVPLELRLGESIANVLEQTEPLEGELRILHGDTIVLDFPFKRLDVVSEGVTNEYYSWAEYKISPKGKIQFFDGLMSGLAANSPAGQRGVLSGYFCFSNGHAFVRCLELADYDFIPSLNEYVRENDLTPIKKGQWLDFGHLDQYYQSKAQMTTERIFNEIHISRRTVRKSSEDREKMRAEAAWFENLPNPLKVFIPQYLGKFSDHKFEGYETEYLYLSTLSDLSVYGRLPTYVWQRIFQSCDDYLITGKKFQPDTPPSYSHQLYLDKTLERLTDYARQTGIDLTKDWYYAGQTLPNLNEIAIKTAALIPKASKESLQIIHGDFCFSNILYDFRANSVRLIDPRGRTIDQTPSIYGDVRYDIAKLYQSAVAGYDFIVCEQHHLEDDDEYKLDLTLPASTEIIERQTIFRERKFAGYSLEEASSKPIAILLFLSMLPLHHDSTTRQRAFLANALRLYAELGI
ncbi:MAG: hypothetical protein VX617_05425 [Pseudomonadota bacterium]|nr:hypothetical protein [Pseudomonadota bacterium]